MDKRKNKLAEAKRRQSQGLNKFHQNINQMARLTNNFSVGFSNNLSQFEVINVEIIHSLAIGIIRHPLTKKWQTWVQKVEAEPTMHFNILAFQEKSEAEANIAEIRNVIKKFPYEDPSEIQGKFQNTNSSFNQPESLPTNAFGSIKEEISFVRKKIGEN